MNTAAIEDYITAIYRMQKKNEIVKSKDIADYLGIGKSSVSEMVARLAEAGMVEHNKYSNLKLTENGERKAGKIIFKHRVIELFLTKMLKRNKKTVHDEAHKLEHAFSDESVKTIYKLLGEPKTGAHGEEIPAVDLGK